MVILCVSRWTTERHLVQVARCALRRGFTTKRLKANSVTFFSNLHSLDQKNILDTNITTKLPESTCVASSDIRVSLLKVSRLAKIYSQLSKSRLTYLIILSTMSGFALSPLPTTVPMLLCTAIGTGLCSASANTFNQIVEAPFDAQMPRTRTRPLVRGAISSAHATIFGVLTGATGIAMLACVNPIAGFLGALNIGLYAGVYTRMKRKSILNTWVGSVVGGIPPLIGWTACGGHIFPATNYPIDIFLPPFLSNALDIIPHSANNPLSACALFCLLYCWQFPHFNSLAHLVRESYTQGGYKMLSVMNPMHNALVSYRYALCLIGVSSILTPVAGLTTWTYAITSLVPNIYLTRAAHRFWKSGTQKNAKALFHVSLWYLPLILALMMVHKQETDWLVLLGFTEPPAKTQTVD